MRCFTTILVVLMLVMSMSFIGCTRKADAELAATKQQLAVVQSDLQLTRAYLWVAAGVIVILAIGPRKVLGWFNKTTKPMQPVKAAVSVPIDSISRAVAVEVEKPKATPVVVAVAEPEGTARPAAFDDLVLMAVREKGPIQRDGIVSYIVGQKIVDIGAALEASPEEVINIPSEVDDSLGYLKGLGRIKRNKSSGNFTLAKD